VSTVSRSIGAAKALEDMRQMLRRNPLPCVGHRQFHRRPHCLRGERDFAARRNVAQGVSDQVADHLCLAVHVRHYAREARVGIEDENCTAFHRGHAVTPATASTTRCGTTRSGEAQRVQEGMRQTSVQDLPRLHAPAPIR